MEHCANCGRAYVSSESAFTYEAIDGGMFEFCSESCQNEFVLLDCSESEQYD